MFLVWDLQIVLYILLCLGIAGVGVLVWAVRRRPALQQGAGADHAAGLLDALNRAPLGVLIMEDQRILYLNTAARDLLHLPEGVVPVLPLTDWSDLLLADLAAVRQAIPGAVPSDTPAPAGRLRNVTFASGNTVRWWVVAEGSRDVVLVFDISAQQRAVGMARSLISDLGHELRTPIATLLTHLEILGLDDVGEAVHAQSWQLARQETQRMSRLVNDILELGRLEMAESLTRRPVNLVKLVEEALVQVSPQSVEREIALAMTSSGALPLVMGHADRLRQVWLNLLDNALKYAGRGARVTVSLEAVTGGVQCACTDTGPGIAPEHLPYIAQRFYRARADSGGAPDSVDGSGLGLALVEEILTRHGAALEVISPVSEGRGTCIRFVLPVAVEEVVS